MSTKIISGHDLIASLTRANIDHSAVFPVESLDDCRSRMYYEIKPEKCTRLSAKSDYSGYGCIVHPPSRYIPAVDGKINYSMATYCNPTLEDSHATQIDSPSFQYEFNAPESGTLYAGAIWDIEVLSIRCRSESILNPFCTGDIGGFIDAYIQIHKKINNAWSYITGSNQSLLSKRYIYDNSGINKYVPSKNLVVSMALHINDVTQGEGVRITTGIDINHRLYSLNNINGEVEICVKCGLRLINFSYD